MIGQKTFSSPLAKVRNASEILGLDGAFWFCIAAVWRRLPIGKSILFKLKSKLAKHPMWCRPQTSDFGTFLQIYFGRPYQCLDQLENVELVVDCGANVGYSAAYFLTTFPQCKLIAIEPDPENFEMMVRNLKPYGQRATLIKSAVWSSSVPLVISEETCQSGNEWGRQVRECRPGEKPSMVAIDIAHVLQMSGHKRISVLKMDIEGAEAKVFSEGYESWIDSVDAIAIELHKDNQWGSCADHFFKAIANQNFQIQHSGELVVCTRNTVDRV